jgi:hypothetical protein
LIDYEFVIKPILVRVCGELFGLNCNNSLSLWNFDEYFLKCRVRTSALSELEAAARKGTEEVTKQIQEASKAAEKAAADATSWS